MAPEGSAATLGKRQHVPMQYITNSPPKEPFAGGLFAPFPTSSVVAPTLGETQVHATPEFTGYDEKRRRIVNPPSYQLQKPLEIVPPKVVDPSPPTNICDDDKGHYVINSGERFAGGRYIITRQLGQGTFGKVAEAWDERTQSYCAIKIIRTNAKYREASKIELRVLSMISQSDPYGSHQCVRMTECFDYRDHVCLVTELLDISVYDFLKSNSFSPFPGSHILSFARQLLNAVAYIHDLGLVHTDLKPENILLYSAAYKHGYYRRGSRGPNQTRKELKDTRIKLIDFGSAIFDDEYHSSIVSTRHYRAPEIVLGTGWTYSCDMWSVGSVLVELCTGSVLFQTRDNLEHLHMMEKTLATRFPPAMIEKARKTNVGSTLVDDCYNRLKSLSESKHISSVHRLNTVTRLIQSSVPYTRERQFWDQFLDLIHALLRFDPTERLTAHEALEHPWITQSYR